MKTGKNVKNLNMGDRVGIPWLGHTDGSCKFCLKGLENLCDNPIFTGYTMDGGLQNTLLAIVIFVSSFQRIKM